MIYSSKLKSIFERGWVVTLGMQGSDRWNVTMAVSSNQLSEGNHISCWGGIDLDKALSDCEEGIINRWDELHPNLDKAKFGYYE